MGGTLANDAWLVKSSVVLGSIQQIFTSYDGNPEADTTKLLAAGPDMLFSSPNLAHDFFAIRIDTGVTQIYNDSTTSVLSSIPRVCFYGRTYPVLVEGRVLGVVGRATGGNEATLAQPELIYYSEDAMQNFIEKGQSMFTDYSVVGITGAHADWSSD